MKKCTVCTDYKELDEFYKNSRAKDGLMSRCISCFKIVRKRQRAKQAADPEWKKKFNHKNTISRRKAGKIGQLYTAAQQRAFQKGIEFTITKDDIVIPETCPVLGIPISAGSGRKGDADPNERKLVGATDNSPSLDRIDNELGYIPGNIRVISWRANYLKNNSTLQEMMLLGYDASRTLMSNTASLLESSIEDQVDSVARTEEDDIVYVTAELDGASLTMEFNPSHRRIHLVHSDELLESTKDSAAHKLSQLLLSHNLEMYEYGIESPTTGD